MKKLVNGAVVDIKNIELFEKALEALAVGRKVTNSTLDISNLIIGDTLKYVSKYSQIYESLPYPLNALDDDIKYNAIADILRAEFTGIDTWVNGGLSVKLDGNKILRFINNTWGIELEDEHNTNSFGETRLDNFKDRTGYLEYKWAVQRIIDGKDTSSFYTTFMKDFIEACKSQPMLLKWELSNILNFGSVPTKLELYTNRIYELFENNLYSLDIYTKGMRKTDESRQVWDLTKQSTGEPEIKHKYIKSYNFDVYKKELNLTEDQVKPNKDKIYKTENMHGMTSMFLTLIGIKTAGNNNNFEDYTGIICDNNLVYEINNRIFIAKATQYKEPKEIARGVTIHSYDRGLVYLVKKLRVSNDIDKESMYAYNLNDNSMRLVRIIFKSI